MTRFPLFIAILVVSLLSVNALSGHSQPTNELTGDGLIRDWLLLGPFPNSVSDERLPDGSFRNGLYQDFLKALGGEAQAILSSDTVVEFTDSEGETRNVSPANCQARGNGVVSFREAFNIGDKVGYAFCHVESPADQVLHCGFGSNDGAKVWLNGELVNKFYGGRGCVRWNDEFQVALKKGLNPVLVKLDDWGGMAWEFILEFHRSDAPVVLKRLRQRELERFQNGRIRPRDMWSGFVIEPGEFPELVWDNPDIAEKILGEAPLEVRWFDADLKEAGKADNPGRYAAVVEATGENGIQVRRAFTFYCRPAGWRPWEHDFKTYLRYPPDSPIDRSALDQRKEMIAGWLGNRVLWSMGEDAAGASLLAALAEMKPLDRKPLPTDAPEILSDDYHLALKRKILGLEERDSGLSMPKPISDKPAPALRDGSFSDAGVKADGIDPIREVCTRWHSETKEPFVVLLARHGVVFFHEAFGEPSKADLDTPMSLASLTKLITGLLFAQFVDQGLVGIDDPVGNYVPDLPTEGEKALTFRHCFTHTSGLTGHGDWDGIHNPWLENVIANGLEYLSPGERYYYNGMGLDLAGKAMEMVANKSICRLMYENFFVPLGVKNFTLEDLAFSASVTAEELARFGQLLLNRGSYGDRQFFSEQTFEAILPRPLDDFYPGVEEEVGIGLWWMRIEKWLIDQFGDSEDVPMLSENILGHGAASGAILRVDLDNDLVVAQVRNAPGEKHEEFLYEFLRAIAASLE